jgi:IS30 family transposase
MPARHQPSKPSKPHLNSHLSDSEITRILTLDHFGLSGRAIARQVDRGESTIRRILKTYDYKTFDIRDRTRINKRKTTNRED